MKSDKKISSMRTSERKTESSSINVTLITNQHESTETNKNQSITEVKSRPLERIGADCNDEYFIDDRSEININFQKYRMVFVVNKDAVFYKKSAITQARKTHPKITKARANKFHKFVQKWCEENVNEEQNESCVNWFMGRQQNQIPNIVTIKLQENDLSKTPYALYNRYKVQHLNA
ncbi:paired amphipathic helix protein Sin3a-like isoform X2 [Contarinia nasturtii]|uniref:paired amphipathic helix protein Sin3a-like isoform X2 n=1 Tax=Contarinia nasturtii TaxID=265458 RepID=UPI0012D3E27E|nr:paired amphipathic helix protein Sin3a-like isoform X2 [Contarinia nasturtii]